jgi:hypothetical protein
MDILESAFTHLSHRMAEFVCAIHGHAHALRFEPARLHASTAMHAQQAGAVQL